MKNIQYTTMKSIFTDKANVPNDADLQNALGETYDLWQILADYVHEKYSAAFDEWNYIDQKSVV